MNDGGQDWNFLVRAITQAQKGVGHTRPNPPVGAVIVKGGEVVADGYHHRCGMPHAEVEAIAAAKKENIDIVGATMYVTLEPCSTQGRVGACTDAIIAAGIKDVIYGWEDPNPVNRGKAEKALAAAGVKCRRFSLQSREAQCVGTMLEKLYAPFTKLVTKGLPYITVKMAMSLDGKTVDDYGNAKWISSEAARRKTDAFRHAVDAIMVGAETVRRDDPLLLPHFDGPNDDLIRVVISRSGKLPEKARVFTEGKNQTLVFDDLEKALGELAKLGCLHVLCEGGRKLAVELAEKRFVDQWITVLAPKVIGNRAITEAVEIKDASCLEDCGG